MESSAFVAYEKDNNKLLKNIRNRDDLKPAVNFITEKEVVESDDICSYTIGIIICSP
jgi:hypothetical protein